MASLLHTAPFTIYNASAGSGKTFTVARNYIAALLTDDDEKAYRKILAITFTNKAVAEMKSRIIDSLGGFALAEIPKKHRPLFEAVQELTGLPPEKIQAKSKHILKTILHNYAGFDISTIDGFTQRLLRTFAKDLNIPMNFEIELDTKSILEEAVDRLIAKVGTDKHLTKALIAFAIAKIDDDKSWDITTDLYSSAQLLTNEDNYEYLKKLSHLNLSDFSDFIKNISQQLKDLAEKRIHIANQFFELITSKGLVDTDFTRSYIPKYFKKAEQPSTKLKIGTATWIKNIDSISMYNKGQNADKKSLMDSLQPQIAVWVKQFEDSIGQTLFFKDIIKSTPALSLITAIDKELQALKKERNILLISEFNRKISKSIAGQPAPFIYERLGERYDTYYIDEFQDTSVLQWQNLLPLLSESLTHPQGKVTLVGDAKQSIYRWRGGRAEQFIDLCTTENPFRTDKYIETLPDNYRSKAEIVTFNNAFYQYVAQTLTHQPYRELFNGAAQNPKQSDGGYVHIEFIEAKNEAEENELYPEKVVQVIEHLQEEYPDNYPLYKDICILVRKKKQGIAIANYLTEHNIPIVSSETLLINNSIVVQFIATILEISLNTTNKSLKFILLNILHQRLQPDCNSFDFISTRLELEHQDFFDSFKSFDIQFSLQKLKRLPLYDAVEYCLRSFKLQDEADAYVQFFLDFTYDYTQSYSGGIAGFIELWNRKKDKLSIIAPEGSNAVQIMTIHKSKGLEFPIVIYPYASEKIDDTKMDRLWVDISEYNSQIPLTYLSAKKDLSAYSEKAAQVYNQLLIHKQLDTANLFYVALTRAEQQLYILSKYDVNSKGEVNTSSYAGLLINFLKEKNLWQEAELAYAFGEIKAPKDYVDSQNDDNFITTKYLLSTAPESHSLNLVTRSGQLWGSEQELAITQGNILHELLKDIEKAEDIKPVLLEAEHKGLLLKNELESYHKQLTTLVTDPQLETYFSADYQVFTEKEIIYKGEFKRLDRLCLNDKQAVIIDYKTGKPKKSHVTQINLYAQAITAFGYQVTDKLLVYLEDQPKIKAIA